MKQNISYRRAGGLMADALGLAMLAGGALAQPAGDAKNGKKIFNKCKSCHVLTAKNTKKTGPTLYGVFGRKAGSTDFKYGKSIVAAGEAGLIWDEAKNLCLFDGSKGLSGRTAGYQQIQGQEQDDGQAERPAATR